MNLIKNKEKIIRIIFFIFGLILLSFGISLIIKSEFGTSAWDAVSVGLFKHFNLSVGIWMNIVAVILVISSGIMLKKMPRLTTLITSIVLGGCLDFWLFSIRKITIDSTVLSIILFLMGVVIMAFGVATYLVSKLPPNPLDYFMVCVHEKLNISIAKARTICEGIGFILGILLSGPIGIGTIIILIMVGPTIQFFLNYTNKIYEYVEEKFLREKEIDV